MQKKITILLTFFWMGTHLMAQQNTTTTEYPVVNWGFKVGLNALSPTHYHVYYEGNEIANPSITNKVGYIGTLFFRVNLANFFMQPEASFNYYRENCSFMIPSSNGNVNTSLSTNNNSGSIIVLAGYNIVKEGPCMFNGFIGSNFKYTYHTNYTTNLNSQFEDKEKKYNLNGIVGFSLHISRLCFDFRYEISRPNTDVNFRDIENAPSYLREVSIKKNENILSFSCGMMF